MRGCFAVLNVLLKVEHSTRSTGLSPVLSYCFAAWSLSLDVSFGYAPLGLSPADSHCSYLCFESLRTLHLYFLVD